MPPDHIDTPTCECKICKLTRHWTAAGVHIDGPCHKCNKCNKWASRYVNGRLTCVACAIQTNTVPVPAPTPVPTNTGIATINPNPFADLINVFRSV